MHQVTMTPGPLRHPLSRCVAPSTLPISLPCEGFSHSNSLMLFHPDLVVITNGYSLAAASDSGSKQAGHVACALTARSPSRECISPNRYSLLPFLSDLSSSSYSFSFRLSFPLFFFSFSFFLLFS